MSENSSGVPTIYMYIYIYIYDLLFFLFFQDILDILEFWPTLFFWEVLTNFLASPETRNVSAKCGGLGDPQGFKVGVSFGNPNFWCFKKNIIDLLFFRTCLFFFCKVVAKVEDFNLFLGKRIGIPWTVSKIFDESGNKNSPACQRFNQSLSFQGSCHGWAHVWGTWVTS